MSIKQKVETSLSDQTAITFPVLKESLGIMSDARVEEKTFPLFQPDVLLPTQYYATTKRKDHPEPEKKLMLAVLENAIWCFQTCLFARDKRRKSLFSEAEEWIMEENGDGLFSFESICEVLGLNPTYVREGLTRWKEKALAGRVKAQVYRLAHTGEREKRGGHKPRTPEHNFLKAAGY